MTVFITNWLRVVASARRAIPRIAVVVVLALSICGTIHADDKVDKLVESLKSGSDEEKESALRSLIELGPKAKDAVPQLILSLEDKNATVRYGSVVALATIGEEAKSAAPAMVKRLEDPEREVRSLAIQAISRLGPTAMEPLIEGMQGKTVRMRVNATTAAGQFSPEHLLPAFDALKKCLADKNDDVRSNAALCLSFLGEKSKPLIPIFREMCGPTVNRKLRSNALRALFLSGDDQEFILPHFIQQLEDPQEDLAGRVFASLAIGRMEKKFEHLVPLFIRLAKTDKELMVRINSPKVLGRITDKPETVLPTLEDLLDDPAVGVRSNAAYSIGNFLEKGADSFPKLHAHLKGADANDALFRYHLIFAMRGFGAVAEPAFPEIISSLDHDDPEVRLAAVQIARVLKIKAARERLATMTKDDDEVEEVRNEARETLKALDG